MVTIRVSIDLKNLIIHPSRQAYPTINYLETLSLFARFRVGYPTPAQGLQFRLFWALYIENYCDCTSESLGNPVDPVNPRLTNGPYVENDENISSFEILSSQVTESV